MTDLEKQFEPQALKERLFNDPELIKEISAIFLEDTPIHIAELISYINAQDCESAKQTAHKIKGAAANMSAEYLQAIAKKMEVAGENRDSQTLTESISELEEAYAILEKELSAFLEQL